MPSFPKKMPLLRVQVDREGRLSLYTRFDEMTEERPGWWDAVLNDPRSRPRQVPDWMDLLRMHKGEEIAAHCHRCNDYRTLLVDDLIARYGGVCDCIAAVMAGSRCTKRPNACEMIYATRKIPDKS